MSQTATEWAWGQAIKPASAKLVLLCLADHHNQATGRCNPSILAIANATGLDRKTVIPAIKKLEEIGSIITRKNFGSWTQYDLQTSPKNGTGMEADTSTDIGTGRAKTSTENGTGKPVPILGQVEQKPVPELGPLSPDQSQKRDTNLKHKRINNKTYTPDHMKLAEWILGKVQTVTCSTKKPNLEAWADDIRKLNEIDGRELRLIGEVFLFAHNDQFWRPNILSPARLRAQFDNLFVKFNGGSHATHRPASDTGTHQPKLTPAQRTAAKREALRSQSPALGIVATDGGDIRPPVGLAAGGRTE